MQKSALRLAQKKSLQVKRYAALKTSLFILVSANAAYAADAPQMSRPGAVSHVNNLVGQNSTPRFTGAVSVHGSGQQMSSAATSGSITSGLNLDLSSAVQSIILANSTFRGQQDVAINVNGALQTFHPGDSVTAAQYAAIRQMLATGNQSLMLGDNGAATGGRFSLNYLSRGAAAITVPQNVTALSVFSPTQNVAVSGDLINNGTISGIASGGAANANISALNIVNSGLITTNLSSTPLSLTLQAANNISNSGTISSSGALNLIAGGNVVNSANAVMSAASNISLFTGAGNLTNAGLVNSATGNIFINTNPGVDLNINATGGTFQALAGNITVRDSVSSAINNINMTGGDYLSQSLNLFGGQGTIESHLGDVTGVLHSCAAIEHFSAATKLLTLGDNILLGDPTFVNTAGNILITGKVTNGPDTNLAIIAAGDITTTASGQIDTSTLSGQGANVYIIAGAVATVSGTTGATSDPPFDQGGTAPLQLTSGTVSVDLAQVGTGGNVNFSASTTVPVINSSSADGNAGNVTIVALTDATGAKGKIDLPSTSVIDTSAHSANNTGGKAGDVTIITNTKNPGGLSGITIGGINAAGQNSGGNVHIGNESVSGTISFDQTGQLSGSYTIGSPISGSTAAISTQDIITAGGGGASSMNGGNGGSITVNAWGSAQLGNLIAYGGGGGGGGIDRANQFALAAGNGGSGGSISLFSASDTISAVEINSSGGGGGGQGIYSNHNTGSTDSSNIGTGGKAGTVSIAANNIIAGRIFAVDGGSGGTAQFTGNVGGGGGGGGFGGAGGGGGQYGWDLTPNVTGGGGGGAGYNYSGAPWANPNGGGGSSAEAGSGQVYGGAGGGVFGFGAGGLGIPGQPNTDGKSATTSAGGDGGGYNPGKGGLAPSNPGLTGGGATSLTGGAPSMSTSANADITLLAGTDISVTDQIYGKTVNAWALAGPITVNNVTGSNYVMLASAADKINASGKILSGSDIFVFASGAIEGTVSYDTSKGVGKTVGNIYLASGCVVDIDTNTKTVTAHLDQAGLGGGITLTSLPSTSLFNTSSTNKNGGNVNILSLGAISLTSSPDYSINTSSTANTAGNVLVVSAFAPPVDQDSIKIDDVFAGGQLQGGNVDIIATSLFGSYSVDQTGAITDTTFRGIGSGTPHAKVTVNDVVTGGGGGYTSSAGTAQAGGSAGNISIIGGLISARNILAYGGGGGGGFGETPLGKFPNKAADGGAGGAGGNVTLTSQGSITVQNMINTSGGGGGGGSGAANFGAPAPIGGKGGLAGKVNISNAGSLSVTNLIVALDGADGGTGGIYTPAGPPYAGGGGGGGGASWGGGGGGGAGGGGGYSGQNSGAGGGGAGGLYISSVVDHPYMHAGGGGGGGSSDQVNGGGQGGGVFGGGAGGTGFTFPPINGYGANGNATGGGGDGGTNTPPGYTAGKGGAATVSGGGGQSEVPQSGGLSGGKIPLVGRTDDVVTVNTGDVNVTFDLLSAGNTTFKSSGTITNGGGGVMGNTLIVSADKSIGTVLLPFAFFAVKANINSTNGDAYLSTLVPDTHLVGSNSAAGVFSLLVSDGGTGAGVGLTIDSGAKITAPTVSLVLNQSAPSNASILQMDGTPAIFTGNLTASISNNDDTNGIIRLITANGTSPTTLNVSMNLGKIDLQSTGSVIAQSVSTTSGEIALKTSPDSNGNGAILVGSISAGGNVELTSSSSGTGSGGISQTGPLSSPSVVFKGMLKLADLGSSSAPGSHDISIGFNDSASNLEVSSFSANTQGAVTLATDSIAAIVNWLSSSASSFSLSAPTAQVILNNTTQTFAGPVRLDLITLINGKGGEITGSNVEINGISGKTLSVDNSGLIESNSLNGELNISAGVNSSLFFYASAGAGTLKVSGGGTAQINISAPYPTPGNIGSITFAGDQHLRGPAVITAQSGTQFIQAGGAIPNILVDGDSMVWLKTPNYIQSNGGKITGNPLIVGAPGLAGVIANSQGDVNLPTSLTFVGSSLAILASGNINSTGLTSINLAGNNIPGSTFGGDLTLIAGYNFAPPTGGQVGPNASTYTVTSQSTGGSINLSGVSIDLSSTAPNVKSGTLLAVAHNGSIALGSINTSSIGKDSSAGAISIIGQNGVTVAAINSTGDTAGNVTISASDSQLKGTTVVSNGTLFKGGFAPLAGTFNNNIALQGNLNAGTANVSLSTGASGAITAVPGSSITAAKLTMTAGSGGIGGPGASISSSAPIISANAIGNVFLTSSAAAASLLASSGSNFNLTYTGVGGTLSLDGALSADNLNLSSTNNGSFVIAAQIAGLNNPNANSVSISANGTGTIADTAQLAPTIQTSVLNISSGTGTIGTSLFNIKTNASTVTASTNSSSAGGGVFIDDSNTSAVTINGLSAGSTLSSIVFTGQASVLSLDGQVSGNAISISNQGAINVNNKITGAGAVSVTAAGNLNVQNVIQGVGITLQTQNLSGGAISIDNKVTSTGSTIDVLSDGNITTSNTLSGTAITLQNTGSSGTIKVGGTITGTGLVTLSAKGDLSTSSPISAGTLAVSTSAGSSGSVSLGGSINVTADADIAADNNITTSGSITGVNINVHNSGTTGNIKIGGTITGSGLVTLAARGDLSTSNQIKGDGITMSTSAGSGGNVNAGGVLNSTKAVLIQSDNDIVTGASIKGTTITLTNTGTIGSMTLGGSLNGTGAVILSAKGDLSSSSLINGSSIDMSTAAGSSGSITIKGPVSSSGNVTLKSDNNISTTATISGVDIALTNAGPSGGTSIGGTVTGTGSVDVNAAGNIDVKSAITGNKVTLKTSTGTNGNINIGANITATDAVATDVGVTLDADGVGAVTQTTGVIGSSGSIVSIKSASGDLGTVGSNLVVNTATVTANTAGNVFVRSAGSATTLDNSSGNIFQITALGNLTVGGKSGGLNANFISLSTLNNGNLTIAAPINGLAGFGNNASTVNLTVSGTGAVSDTSLSSQTISADTLTLTAFTGDIGKSATPLTTNAASMSANTKGSVYVANTNKGVVLLGASSGKDFNLTTETVSLSANSTFSGTATITTNMLTNPSNTIFTAGTINVTNDSPALPLGPLTVNNGGALVANGVGGSINITSAPDQTLFLGNNGGSTPGTLQIGAQSTAINITAQAKSPTATNQVIFTGNQNFIGDTVINANDSTSQEVTVNTGVTVQGFSKVTVNSNTLNLQGVLIGNPLIFNSPTGFGTIANSQGNVLLSNSSSFVFHGQSLAIIAANNIIALNPILIDLSSNDGKFNGGNGGSLNLLAGFNFTPGTGGQVGPNGVLYQISQSPNAQGGSIQMGNVNIKTSTTFTGALGGNVLAAAHAGSLNNGSITLGTIDSSADASTGTGGNITLIGNGISVGNIKTTADVSGNVTLSSAAPQILGTIVVQNGNFTVGTVQPDPTTYAGNIVVNSINAAGSSIQMQSGGTGSITVLPSAAINAAFVDIISGGAGGIKLSGSSSMNATTMNLTAGSAGIQQTDSTALITTVGTLSLVTTGGDIGSSSIPLNISSPTFSANASGTSSVYITDQHSSSDITIEDSSAGGTFQVLASSAVAHDIVTGLAASISSPTISITSTTGNINVTTGTVNKLSFVANQGTVTLGSNTVSVVPDANGNGGSITLNAATIAPPSATTLTLNANGTGNGNGGTIIFTSGVSSALTATLVLNANAAGTGNGGTVQYTSSNTAPLAIGSGAANLQINATGGSVGSSAGDGGTASISTGGSLTIDPSQLNVGPQGSSGSGSSIALTAGTGLTSATLTINASALSNSGVGNGNGGSFSFRAPNFGYLNSGTQALSLTANGAGTGSGGSITYNVDNISPLTIGGGANSLNLSASSGQKGGNGGAIHVVAGGNLNANPANMFVQPLGTNGNGGTIDLEAGRNVAASEGLLVVTGTINNNGKGTGTGGVVNLTSRSKTDFTIGNPSTLNGITGGITVTGTTNGDVSVTNNSGGIDNSFIPKNTTFGPGLIAKVRNLSFVAGNGNITIGNPLGTANLTESIVLSAGGNVIEKFPAIIVSAKSVALTSATGTLGSTKTAFKVTASNVTAVASGLININDTTTTGVTIGTSSAGGTFTFSTPSAITTTGVINSGTGISASNNVTLTATGANKGITIGESIVALGGTIKLTANGKGAISDTFANRPDSLQASTLLLTGGAIGQIGTSPIALRVTASNVTNKTTGLINIASSGTGPITLAAFKTTNPFNLTAQGDVTLSAASSASTIQIATGNNGSVNINGNLGTASTTSLAITAGGSGNITTATTKVIVAAKSVTLASGTGNIQAPAGAAMTVSTPLLAANTSGAGSVNISDTGTANTTLANSSAGGKFTLLAAGSLTLNNISSTGSTGGGISVTSKGSALTTTGAINSKSGDILLNASKTSAKITIGGSVVTEGASGAGNVSIGIGTLPFATGAGTATGNVTLNPTGTGTINLGVSGITGPSSGSATINAKNAAVVISTGAKGKANQIVLQAGALITGDPPDGFASNAMDTNSAFSSSANSQPAAPTHNAINQAFGVASQTSESASPAVTPLSNYSQNGLIYGYASYQDRIHAGANAAGLALTTQQNSTVNRTDLATASIAAGFNRTGNFTSWGQSDALTRSELAAFFCGNNKLGINGSSTATEIKKIASTAESETYELNYGSSVFAAEKDTCVLTPEGKVHIAAKSVALLMVSSGGLAVFNFDDAHANAVRIESNGKTIPVAPCHQATLVTGSKLTFADANPLQAIAYRGIESKKLSHNQTLFSAEFHLPQAASIVGPLKEIMSSGNPQMTKLKSRMLKTSAIVMMMNQKKGIFQQQLKKAITAYAQ